jgi:hypothetical protein
MLSNKSRVTSQHSSGGMRVPFALVNFWHFRSLVGSMREGETSNRVLGASNWIFLE